jgi:hypothetical protein
MATIREKAPYQWQVQIRRMGWPNQNATFRTKKDAEAWARKSESEMDRGLFVDQSAGRETTLGDLIEIYLTGVTAHRPSANAQVAETARLRRFQRDERALCSYAAVNLKPEHFEDYRDRRLKHRLKNGKTIAPGTVKRELTTLKRVIDYRKRRLGLLVNPVNTEDVKRPAVNDERDVRLSLEDRERCCKLAAMRAILGLAPLSNSALKPARGAAAFCALRGTMLILSARRRSCAASRTAAVPTKSSTTSSASRRARSKS